MKGAAVSCQTGSRKSRRKRTIWKEKWRWENGHIHEMTNHHACNVWTNGYNGSKTYYK